jgi:hypothetical protein
MPPARLGRARPGEVAMTLAFEQQRHADPAPVVAPVAAPHQERLPSGLREELGAQFGTDFDDVHLAPTAAAPAVSGQGADAVTVGSGIAFGDGAYQPGSGWGRGRPPAQPRARRWAALTGMVPPESATEYEARSFAHDECTTSRGDQPGIGRITDLSCAPPPSRGFQDGCATDSPTPLQPAQQGAAFLLGPRSAVVKHASASNCRTSTGTCWWRACRASARR